MISYLSVLSIFALISAVAILVKSSRQKKPEASKYFLIGLIAVVFAVVVDYFGTSTGAWTYNQSIGVLNLGTGVIPVESILLFFSLGMFARFLLVNMENFQLPISPNIILYILMVIVLIPLIMEMSEAKFPDMLAISALVGMWGVLNVSHDNRKNMIILTAMFIAADWMFESAIIGRGAYNFNTSFSMQIALTHGLFALGFLTLIEKLKDRGLMLALPTHVKRGQWQIERHEPVQRPVMRKPIGFNPRTLLSKNFLAIFGIIGAAAVSILFITGYINLTGFTSALFPTTTTTTTTTTVPTTTTTTAPTTTTTTTTTTSTTIPPASECKGSVCVFMSELSCNNDLIIAKLINSGANAMTFQHYQIMKFFVDGADKSNLFTCSPIAIARGEAMTCKYPVLSTGTYDVEVRGPSFDNIETGTVTCS